LIQIYFRFNILNPSIFTFFRICPIFKQTVIRHYQNFMDDKQPNDNLEAGRLDPDLHAVPSAEDPTDRVGCAAAEIEP